jgi:hypothetical protein
VVNRAAGTRDGRLVIVRMDVRFHDGSEPGK